MQQFEFKEQIVQVYLQRYSSPPKRKELSGSSYLQDQRKRILDDIRFDAGELCSKRPFTQCGKCDVRLCVDSNLSYHTL